MLLRWGGILLLGTSAAFAADGNWPCEIEVAELRGVSLGRGRFVNFYNDLDLAAYLTALLARTHPDRQSVVLPVYSPEPLMVTRGHRVYISTGALLAFEREEDLSAALAALPLPKRCEHQRFPRPCSLSRAKATPKEYGRIWSRVQQAVLRYQEWTRKNLRIRSWPTADSTATAASVPAETGR